MEAAEDLCVDQRVPADPRRQGGAVEPYAAVSDRANAGGQRHGDGLA